MAELVDDDSTQNPIAPPSPVSSNIDGSSVEPVNVNNVQPSDSTYGGKDAGVAANSVMLQALGVQDTNTSIHYENGSPKNTAGK